MARNHEMTSHENKVAEQQRYDFFDFFDSRVCTRGGQKTEWKEGRDRPPDPPLPAGQVAPPSRLWAVVRVRFPIFFCFLIVLCNKLVSVSTARKRPPAHAWGGRRRKAAGTGWGPLPCPARLCLLCSGPGSPCPAVTATALATRLHTRPPSPDAHGPFHSGQAPPPWSLRPGCAPRPTARSCSPQQCTSQPGALLCSPSARKPARIPLLG